ncbi:MAG: MotA/TolQ/ExbB proton channel family protein [Alphaproteobacteria bacterium]|nr:MotA/TolQ/ExbB proton channel family protein [Alphaproteobacteria bacterium]
MLDYLLAAFSGPGAGFMYAITAVGAFALAIGIERSALLALRWRADLPEVRVRLDAGDFNGAVGAAGASPMGEVLGAGASEASPEAAWEAMGAAAASAEARMRARVGALGAVSNIATMLGLLGTVYGLILAFSALGDASAGERAVKLSEGISTAMATTAFGLLVGIPALGLHAWLEGLVSQRLADIEVAAGALALAKRRSGSDA